MERDTTPTRVERAGNNTDGGNADRVPNGTDSSPKNTDEARAKVEKGLDEVAKEAERAIEQGEQNRAAAQGVSDPTFNPYQYANRAINAIRVKSELKQQQINNEVGPAVFWTCAILTTTVIAAPATLSAVGYVASVACVGLVANWAIRSLLNFYSTMNKENDIHKLLAQATRGRKQRR